MSISHFENLIRHWDSEIHWTDDELGHLSGILSSICEDNNGTILHDVELSDDITKNYMLETVEVILNAYAADIVKKQFKQNIPNCRAKTDEFSVDLPFLEAAKHVPRINLNLATHNELENLPGIGAKTAARIIAYRNKHGGVKKITELRNVKGISDKEIQKFAHKVYLKSFKSIVIASDDANSLIDEPTFSNFIAYLKKNNILISLHSRNPANLKDLIIREIEGINNKLKMQARLHGYSPGIRASKLRNRLAEKAELKKYIDRNKTDVTHGVVLRDAGYYYFTQKLIASARQRIRLIMFYFMFLDEQKHPSDKLMNELIKAKKRGVDVKVILDHQEESDPKLSSIINKDAADYLHKNGIPVTFDTKEIATHTKLLLVDDKHVVIGSHNWTAGSYFLYRDTSVYLNSDKLAGFYYSQFDNLWETYQQHPAVEEN